MNFFRKIDFFLNDGFSNYAIKNIQLRTIVSSRILIENREILHKDVLTPQEYGDYLFWKKIEEKIEKPVEGVSSRQDSSKNKLIRKRK